MSSKTSGEFSAVFFPRGGTFCNHEEEEFATTRRKILQPRGGYKTQGI